MLPISSRVGARNLFVVVGIEGTLVGRPVSNDDDDDDGKDDSEDSDDNEGKDDGGRGTDGKPKFTVVARGVGGVGAYTAEGRLTSGGVIVGLGRGTGVVVNDDVVPVSSPTKGRLVSVVVVVEVVGVSSA